MPRFLMMIRTDEQDLPVQDPGPEFKERMGALVEESTKAGAMLDGAGLVPTSDGTRVTRSGGAIGYTDGPFTESKQVVSGFAILQAKDKAEALAWTKRYVEIQPEHWTVTFEVREITEG